MSVIHRFRLQAYVMFVEIKQEPVSLLAIEQNQTNKVHMREHRELI